MLRGTLTVTSVHPVSGEESVHGELVTPGQRGGLPFRSVRGDSLSSRAPELAARIATRLRELDARHGEPVRASFSIDDDTETLGEVRPAHADLGPLALVRVLVERTRDGRMLRDAALARLDGAVLDATGNFVLAEPPPAALARGLGASPGVASGRLALPEDVVAATDDEPRVLVIDDASPEDASALRRAAAIVATSGGLTADAAIAARALRKPCVVSAGIQLGDRDESARGAWVTVDGGSGQIHAGRLRTTWRAASPYAEELLHWLSAQVGEPPSAAYARWNQARSH